MKVLFLDHDGVICLSNNWGSRYKKKEGMDSRFDKFDRKAITVLNEIIKETDCEIVISSDWRFHCSLKEMRDMYAERGIRKLPIGFTGFIPGKPEDLEHSRSQEIVNWMNVHDKYTRMKWCAVDDLDMSPWIGDNFVLTKRSSEGLKQSGIKEKIIKMLNE